ncbi:ATP-dependent RNA helicase DHX8/PRP22 [Cryptococcus wingfieldii CBS 7118]|uniref:RNA helicase n=1 Tax=Cryptococcus wingfieldii CBS 7118 TaxID=1295528 RepID=A0A1E3I5W6_9TREE|nr:ATP-dependent RNA helicase DHX8/PRP22 [Cryptococcus wingfieldii CBS 7118]ODN83765.1 ATP-dependent RNA helicase DHX8/PRP22 [Cryptococcus wingfieldii CBS 7118]
MSADKEIYKLELLSLVAKVSQELYNHTKLQDKKLAEFVISLHEQSKTPDAFSKKLVEIGADFPEWFVKNLDRLIVTLHPKYKRKAAKAKAAAQSGQKSSKSTTIMDEQKQLQARKYPGLAMPDREAEKFVDDTPDTNVSSKTLPDSVGVDDTLAQLSSLSSRRARPSADDYMEGEPSAKRSRGDTTGRDNGYGGYGRNHGDGRDNGYGSRSGGYSGTSYGDRGRSGRSALDQKPLLYKIYDGTVTNIKDFGAFVTLDGVQRNTDGMVHVSSITSGRVNNPAEFLKRNQRVKVKVMSVSPKVGLSMKDVDQMTGADLSPHLMVMTAEEAAQEQRDLQARAAASGSNSMPLLGVPDLKVSRAKRLSSPERFEIKQLIASGAVSAADYPDLDDDFNTESNNPEIEEDIDVEVNEVEPAFLAGQTKVTLELSPVKIIKAPDGMLNRAALAGGTLAKERRDLKRLEANEEADAESRDVNQPWLDPMANQNERQFATDIKGSLMGQKATQTPAWKAANKVVSYGKITSMSIQEQRKSLPIYKLRDQLVSAIRDNQILVVVGDTGSGKTTQMAQYLAEEGFLERGKLGCTQPRKVAAVSVAKRVSEEVGCRLGAEVGYTIRFEDMTSPETKIKYMTDGMLLRELLVDPDCSKYSVLMLDEAHERTIATDVLFGLLKKACKRRPDLKLICTSATLDAAKFAEYFWGCPIFTIPGRTYPVETLYTKEPEPDYLEASLITILQIHLMEPAGDVLLFLTGQEEIDTACEVLYERVKALGPQVPELIILPVYAALPSEMQSRIFEPAPPGARKIVIATNIAETSITIDGIYYVIDPGFAKQNAYDPKLGMDSLIVTPISQAQARQRAGRAGRTGPGKCYRLYTEIAYRNEMLPNPIPEIQRTNLASTILTLKAMGINDLINFDFMDPPPAATMLTALEQLYALGALDDEGLLTRIGRKMADFPLDPPLSKMLIMSVDYGCSEEALTIVAMLQAGGQVYYRPKDKQSQADAKKAKFHQPEGDLLTLLAVYNGWRDSKFSNPWCFENFIQTRAMKTAQDVRKQLIGIMDRYKHDLVSCRSNFNQVRMAICSGFFRNAAKKDPTEGYKTLVEGTPVSIHPSSALFQRPPEWCVYYELVLTAKEYMHQVTVIEPKWLSEVAPTFFRIADQNKISKRKALEKIEPLFDRFAADKDDWRLSKQKKLGRSSQTFG